MRIKLLKPARQGRKHLIHQRSDRSQRMIRRDPLLQPDVRKKPFRSSLLAARIGRDRKSTRLNSSHANISYAVFCLKKKNSAPERASAVGQYSRTRDLATVRMR